MRKIIPPPNSVSAFTGASMYVGNDDAGLTKSLAENCDIEGILRTLDHGEMPNLILTDNTEEAEGIILCSASSIILAPENKVFEFRPIALFNITVGITLDRHNSGGNAVEVGDSGWYLTATTSSNT